MKSKSPHHHHFRSKRTKTFNLLRQIGTVACTRTIFQVINETSTPHCHQMPHLWVTYLVLNKRKLDNKKMRCTYHGDHPWKERQFPYIDT